MEHPAPNLVARLLAHPLYAELRDERALRVHLQHHVFCVWDFQSLLKALQRELTCVQVPWLPTADPAARRLINEIVLDEESDVAPGGGHLSHFEIYREAMRDAGADGAAIDALLAALRRGETADDALAQPGIPPEAARFARTTLAFALGPPHRAAAALAWGREDVIPDMFRRFVDALAQRSPQRWGRLRWYLDRHIDRDGAVHGAAARALVLRLCGGDPRLLDEARQAARESLEARLSLWDAVLRAVRAAPDAEAPLAAATAARDDFPD